MPKLLLAPLGCDSLQALTTGDENSELQYYVGKMLSFSNPPPAPPVLAKSLQLQHLADRYRAVSAQNLEGVRLTSKLLLNKDLDTVLGPRSLDGGL